MTLYLKVILMIKKNNINSFQASILTFYILRASIFGIGLNSIEEIAHQDAWLSALIGIVLGLIPLFIYIYISKRYPNQNIIEINIKLFGKILGAIINFILLLIILYLSGGIFISLTQFTQTNILIRTPVLITSIILLIPIVLAAIKGLEVFTRMAIILFVVSILLFIFAASGLIPYIEIENLKPIMALGILPVIKGSLYYVSITSIPLFLLLVIPRRNIIDSNKYNKSIIKWYLFTNITLFIVIFWVLAILGPKLVTLYNFPSYTILKKISFLDFIERVEGNAIWTLIFDSVFTLIVSFYFIKEIFVSTFSIRNKKWEVVPIIVSSLILLILVSFLVPKWPAINFIFTKYFGPVIGISIFILINIIFIRSLFDKNQTN
jgi:spore germination protein KB